MPDFCLQHVKVSYIIYSVSRRVICKINLNTSCANSEMREKYLRCRFLATVSAEAAVSITNTPQSRELQFGAHTPGIKTRHGKRKRKMGRNRGKVSARTDSSRPFVSMFSRRTIRFRGRRFSGLRPNLIHLRRSSIFLGDGNSAKIASAFFPGS